MKDLIDRIVDAIRLRKADGIEAWGISIPQGLEDWFRSSTTGTLGCASDTCSHASHDPAGPIVKFIPRPGVTLTCLGDVSCSDISELYYHVEYEDVEVFLQLIEPHNSYRATLTRVDKDAIPDCVFTDAIAPRPDIARLSH